MPKLYEWLEDNFLEVSKTYGYETKDKRREYDLPKYHWMDAYLIGIETLKPWDQMPKPFYFKQFRRHNGMGDVVRYENQYFTVKGYTGNYLGFVNDKKYNKSMQKAQIVLKNQGICCL